MNLESFIKEPMQGKTSLSRVVWLYCVLGSLLYGAIELFLDPSNVVVMRVYAIGGLIFSIYVTIATYRCAMNCKSAALGRFVRVSAIISLFLLPVLFYLDLTGALTLSRLSGEELLN